MFQQKHTLKFPLITSPYMYKNKCYIPISSLLYNKLLKKAISFFIFSLHFKEKRGTIILNYNLSGNLSMYIECLTKPSGEKLNKWKEFLTESDLLPDLSVDKTVLVWDDSELIACGSRKDNVLKCIAVSKNRQGENLTATVITALRQDALNAGFNHLFLYTKPENEEIFSSLFFYPVAQTDKVLLLENKKNGISDFLDSLPKHAQNGVTGSIVMNCNPFTLGHQYLIETASNECDHLYVFCVSEDKSEFSYKDRFEMIKLGTAHLKNVTVLPTGPYLISSATFPDYFIKNREKKEEIHCLLDVEIFTKHYAPHFLINKRYVGTEPISKATDMYNKTLKEYLPKSGIELKEIKRLESNNAPISASKVRQIIKSGDIKSIKSLLPQTTYDYLIGKKLI